MSKSDDISVQTVALHAILKAQDPKAKPRLVPARILRRSLRKRFNLNPQETEKLIKRAVAACVIRAVPGSDGEDEFYAV